MNNKPTYEELEQVIQNLEREIAALKGAEKSLHEREEMFRALFEQAGGYCMLLQPAENGIPDILDVNEAACKAHGYTRSEMIGRPVADLDDEEGKRLCKERTNIIMSGKALAIQTNHVRKDGSVFPVAVFANKVQVAGRPPIIMTTEHDVSDIEKAKEEKKQRQAQKMEALGILTGGIAHEFNNLLAPILGFTELLMARNSTEDPDLNYLKQINVAGNRAKELVQQMLAYGRQSMSRRESVRLEVVLEDTIKLIKNTIPPNISITKEIEWGLPQTWGMPNEIQQVLLNLCINATQAMSEGGELKILLEKAGFRKFVNSEGQKREGNYIHLSIEDTGIGMDQATLERLFDPFFTTKKVGQGSGLGLSVVHGIIEQHQGHIEVNSRLGEGSTFHVYFPVTQEEQKPSIVSNNKISLGNERILLIDDETTFVNLAQDMLENFGYKVTGCLGCDEALKRFAEFPQDFDLVITDYGMPKMNGKQLAEKLKEIRPDIPVVLITGYGDLVAKEDIREWGLDEMLMKPFNLKELSEVVRSGLGKSSEG